MDTEHCGLTRSSSKPLCGSLKTRSHIDVSYIFFTSVFSMSAFTVFPAQSEGSLAAVRSVVVAKMTVAAAAFRGHCSG